MKPNDSVYNNPPFVSPVEPLKDRFLAAAFSMNSMEMESVFSDILHFMEKRTIVTESDQKGLYQIKTAMGRLKDRIPGMLSEPASDCRRSIHKYLNNLARSEIRNQACIDFPIWKSNQGFDENRLNHFLRSAVTFQLTSGCSNFCRRCNEWALPGPRKHFSQNAVTELCLRLKQLNNRGFALYCASDPLDWQDGDRTIITLMELLRKDDILPSYGLLTKVPKARGALLADLASRGFDVSVSVTAKNRNRIRRIERDHSLSFSLQHDTEDLLIPSRLDEDFETVKPSITDSYGTEITPDGSFIVIPAFTSALNLTGQRRIPVDGTTRFFPVKKAGRDGLQVEYFKPIQVTGEDDGCCILPHLLETQVENILLDTGEYELTPPGLSSLKTFFQTFEGKAMEKRRQALPSVLERLKKTCPADEYHRKAEGYRNFCNPDFVQKARISAFSFFLESVKNYTVGHPVRSRIIRHLRQNNPTRTGWRNRSTAGRFLQDLISSDDTDAFDLFRGTADRLLKHPHDSDINRFIESFPSYYDKDTHRYQLS